MFLLVIANWGGKEFIIRELSKSTLNRQEINGNLLMSRILLIFVVSVIVLIIKDIKYKPIIIALLAIRSLQTIYDSDVMLSKSFKFAFLVELLISIVFIMLLILFGKNSALWFVYVWLTAELFRLLAYIVRFKVQINWSGFFSSSAYLLKLSFSFLLLSVAGFACSRADLYVLGYMLKPFELNNYYILLNLVILCQVVYTTINGTYSSNLFRINSNSFSRYLSFNLKIGVVFAFLGTFLVNLFNFLYYHQCLSFYFLSLVFLNLFCFSQTLALVYLFTRENKQHIITCIIVGVGIFNILISFLLIPSFGIIGAFISNTASACLTTLLLRLMGRKQKRILVAGN
jgi:O-antigen/teichoic acid export membrane protein